jgi:hypothetical protein
VSRMNSSAGIRPPRHRHDQPCARPGPRAAGRHGHGPGDRADESIKTNPLHPQRTGSTWTDLTKIDGADFTPVRWEDNLDYWRVLHEILDAEPPNPAYRFQYGELAQLGIAKGRAFDPDERMTGILTKAALMGHAQLCVQSFADRRPDRAVWEDTHWEWAVLRPENGTFDAGNYTDLYAREKWFYQAQIESPAIDGTWQLPDFIRA